MSSTDSMEEAVEILQQLGLKVYEARCFVGLSRLSTGTAKQLSEITEVPRTRVYDAIRVLESKGLVEVHYSNPQQYRTVPLTEAIETLRDQYDNRIAILNSALEAIEPIQEGTDDTSRKVWAITGYTPIENRTHQLIRDATDEVVLIVGHNGLVTDDLIDTINDVSPVTNLTIGAPTAAIRDHVKERINTASTFVCGMEFLPIIRGQNREVGIGRLVLVDKSKVMVSSLVPDGKEEHATFASGVDNGLVVLARQFVEGGSISQTNPNMIA